MEVIGTQLGIGHIHGFYPIDYQDYPGLDIFIYIYILLVVTIYKREKKDYIYTETMSFKPECGCCAIETPGQKVGGYHPSSF